MESNDKRDDFTTIKRDDETGQDLGHTQNDHDNENGGQGDQNPQEIEDEQETVGKREAKGKQKTEDQRQLENNDGETLKDLLAVREQELSEYVNLLKRLQAEFDNYRKRTSQAVAAAYNDSLRDVVVAFLPVLDNLERAVEAADDKQEDAGIREGIIKIYKQFKDALGNLGVNEIEAMGCQFDPQVHNAVMQQPKEEGNRENEIVEVFQKGYEHKGKVIRHSMVKVLI